MGREGAFLNMIKAIYERPTANIIFNGQKPKDFPPRSETRKGCPLSPFLFNIVLEVLATEIIQEKNKRHPNWKGGSKTVIVAYDMIVYIKNPMDSTKKLLDLISAFGKTGGYKGNIQKSMAFLYTNNETAETEIRGKNPI